VTQDEIIRMAREVWGERAILPFNELKAFAALVAAHEAEKWKSENKRDYENWKMAAEKAAECEREACAQTVETESQDSTRYEFAAAIRARSEK